MTSKTFSYSAMPSKELQDSWKSEDIWGMTNLGSTPKSAGKNLFSLQV